MTVPNIDRFEEQSRQTTRPLGLGLSDTGDEERAVMPLSTLSDCDSKRLSRALQAASHTLDLEINGLRSLAEALLFSSLQTSFGRAAGLIASLKGRVVVTGMGKSGLVARKIAATLASTGTPSFFIHPADAGHGDLGMIAADDVLLALSWSGETSELTVMIDYCRRFRIPLLAMTAGENSTLANSADLVLLLPRVQEACPHDLAPTTSTTLQLVLGDALAVALIEARGFSPEEFRIFHPRGRLGSRLLRVRQLMVQGEEIPAVLSTATIADAVIEMSSKRLGVTAVINGEGLLVGAFTDGDLRRSLSIANRDEPISLHMTTGPLTVDDQMLASEALALMNERSVSQVFALADGRLAGVLHLHDALRAGIV